MGWLLAAVKHAVCPGKLQLKPVCIHQLDIVMIKICHACKILPNHLLTYSVT